MILPNQQCQSKYEWWIKTIIIQLSWRSTLQLTYQSTDERNAPARAEPTQTEHTKKNSQKVSFVWCMFCMIEILCWDNEYIVRLQCCIGIFIVHSVRIAPHTPEHPFQQSTKMPNNNQHCLKIIKERHHDDYCNIQTFSSGKLAYFFPKLKI